jgi:hypothetical protein
MILPTTWYDAIEILFFSSLFYYLALWLRKDKQQNLLWYFYGYCALTLITYTVNLPTISIFLFLFSPAIIMLFIIIHQDILQRNFVALRHIKPVQKAAHNWIETLIQTALIVINNTNKSITCIVERTDTMHTFLQAPFIIHAPLNTTLLETFINSHSYDQNKMIWIDASGNLEGINASWRQTITEFSYTEQSVCLENALLYTTKTDALVFTIDSETRTFTIIMQGKKLQKINAHHAYITIQKYLGTTGHPQQKQGAIYGTHDKNATHQQHTS